MQYDQAVAEKFNLQKQVKVIIKFILFIYEYIIYYFFN